MALLKKIEKENGVILNYHRITSLNKITNINNIIEVNSYTSENQREKEQEYQDLQKQFASMEQEYENTIFTEQEQEEFLNRYNELKSELEKGINVYIDADYIEVPYDEEMTIEDAYDYLKMTDKYKNAKNDK